MALPYEKWVDRKKISDKKWRELRKQGIGGSDAASIAGQNPYRSKFTTYYDKLGQLPEQEESEAIRLGHDLEEYVAERFTKKTGKKVKNCNYILRSKEYPFMLANVDRMVVGENAVLEVKTTRNYDKYDYANGEYNSSYYTQVLHYMAVGGFTKAYIAIYELGVNLYVIEIDRNETVEQDIQALTELEKQFWEENVVQKIPPVPTGIENDSKFIATAYQANEELPTVDLTALDKQLEEIVALKAQKTALEAEITERENLVKTTLAEATRGESERFKISWKPVTRMLVDSKRLKAENPELYKQFSRPSVSRKFDLTEKNKNI